MDWDYRPRYYGWHGELISQDQWINLMEHTDRHVAEDCFTVNGVEYYVSTVLLGLDHSSFGSGPPIIFETMVFRDDLDMGQDVAMDRYATLEQAREGHAFMVMRFKQFGDEGYGPPVPKPKKRQLLHNGRKP